MLEPFCYEAFLRLVYRVYLVVGRRRQIIRLVKDYVGQPIRFSLTTYTKGIAGDKSAILVLQAVRSE